MTIWINLDFARNLRVWRRSLGGTGGESVSSAGYSLTE